MGKTGKRNKSRTWNWKIRERLLGRRPFEEVLEKVERDGDKNACGR